MEIIEIPTLVVQLDDSLDSFGVETTVPISNNVDEALTKENTSAVVDPVEENQANVKDIINGSVDIDINVASDAKASDNHNIIDHAEPICEMQQIAKELNICINDIGKQCDVNETPKTAEPDQSVTDLDNTLTDSPLNIEPVLSAVTYAEVLTTTADHPSTSTSVGNSNETDTPPQSNPMFFVDHEGSFNASNTPSIPIYDTISDDSYICDKTLTPVKHQKAPLRNAKSKKAPINANISKASPPEIVSDDDVEIIFDSPNMPSPLPKRKRPNVSEDLDDSVVFVSESLSSQPAVRANVNYIKINDVNGIKDKVKRANSLKKSRLLQRLKQQPPVKKIV